MRINKIIFIGIALIAELVGFGSTAAAQPKPLVVVKRVELKDGVLYDAWVEFKDKGNPSQREKRRILGGDREGFPSAGAGQAQSQ